MRVPLLVWVALLAGLILPQAAAAYSYGTPIATDSRIKTFVYNENDVYRLQTHYGYQLNIEFNQKEKIQTISVGDRTGWQIIPSGNRIFVRAMEDKAHTNMTIVTDKRAYQFDLYSAQPGQQGWDELVYVVRFYYPEEEQRGQAPVIPSPSAMQFPVTPPPSAMMPPMGAFSQGIGYGGGMMPRQGGMMQGMPQGVQGMRPQMPAYQVVPPQPPMRTPMPSMQGYSPVSSGMMPSVAAQPSPMVGALGVRSPVMQSPVPNIPARRYGSEQLSLAGQEGLVHNKNYNYSFTGTKALLPSQMFDDGRMTYLQFSANRKRPRLFVVSPDGREREVPLNASNQYLTAPGVYSRMTLRQGKDYACVYNEMKPQF